MPEPSKYSVPPESSLATIINAGKYLLFVNDFPVVIECVIACIAVICVFAAVKFNKTVLDSPSTRKSNAKIVSPVGCIDTKLDAG